MYVYSIYSTKRTITLHFLKIMESFDNRFTSQVDFNYIFCKTFNSLGVLYLLVRYCRYLVLKSYRIFHGNVINSFDYLFYKIMFLAPKFFSMKVRKEWGQPKIMNDKSDAFLCVRLTDHTKLQLHLLQQKLNPSRSLSSFAVKLDPKFAIKIIYSEYNIIIIKLNCTNNYAIIKNQNNYSITIGHRS